ncbi:MAG: LysR family transcriptional regulator [Eubacteriales bacterium]|nr:LysR family transcriptional regulator [Eubacteriales bacterium]
MNWNQLQYVITIAKEKSFTKAAGKLFISQPSLTLSIQSLEKETGVVLFERKRGEVELTYAGKLFYEWAVSTLRSNHQLQLKLNDISEKKRHLIRLGISPHRSVIMLPDILEEFYADYPNCEIHIIEKPTFLLKKLLENNEIDLLIDVANPDTVNYQSDLLVKEEIWLAVPDCFTTKAPLAEILRRPSADRTDNTENGISLQELSGFPFIMLSEDHILGSMSRKLCEASGFHPDIRLTSTNIETALALVRKQLGITFVPEIFAKQKRYYPEVHYYSMPEFHNTRQICLVYHKNLYRHTQLSALIELFRKKIPEIYQY